MPRNIVIYSDGTGQRGGVLFDERRSNIYKLYRASRCGPDSAIDPAEQYAFYDPGIGTTKGEAGLFWTIWNFIYNTVCQASGLGLTGNIIDCYAALVRNWQPGDRVFLIGFSRGAYTVRCLGAVIGLCGIPTKDGDAPLKRDDGTSKRIAKEAVKHVYQHTHSRPRDESTPRQNDLLDQRLELAGRFRRKYHSDDGGNANVYPHFIGVFDTVAALSNPTPAFALLLLGLLAIIGLGWMLSGWFAINWLAVVIGSVVAVAFAAFAGNLLFRVRSEIGLEKRRRWLPFHLLEWRMKFYDTSLNPKVQYARHALAIDEHRKSFNRVRWAVPSDRPERALGEPEWLQQVWFAGCHSDIGGSYPEEESRLSDIALEWMLDAATSVGLKRDPSVLRLYPDPKGPQHDETKRLPFRLFPKIDRVIRNNAPLHETVMRRLRAAKVLQYDLYKPYRPENLRQHDGLQEFYDQNSIQQ
jgi:uncharacterized protein (DUF2235 family)